MDRKKQLLYRISGWGFEKNVKKNERRTIIRHLGPELGKVGFEALKLRGRTLDEAKLNRWMKLEKVTFEGSLDENNQMACVPGKFCFYSACIHLADKYYEANVVRLPFGRHSEKRVPIQTSNYEEQSEFGLQVQESQSISVLRYNGNSFDWNSVDVIGSPRLTKLIGALTIEDCEIPLLDLDSNSLDADDISGSDLVDLCGRYNSAQEENIISRRQSWSTTSISTSQIFRNFGKRSHSGLPFELYPSHTSSSQSHVFHGRYFSSGPLKPKVSESECEIQLQRLKHMQDIEIIHLVEAMGAKAVELYNKNCYHTAETWFRRVVRAGKLVHWYKPHQTLWACLQVAKCLELQIRYKEAQQLHQRLHGTIERKLGADHDISVQSRRLNGDLLDHLGFKEESEAVRRQVLQIRLNTLGVRHPETIHALENLGCTLELLKRPSEAQPLLERSVHFRLETRKNSGSSSTGDIDTLWAMTLLARAFQSDRRYDESEKVLDRAHYLLGDVTRWRSLKCFAYHSERARTYRLQERFENSEKILRGLLKYHLNYMGPGTKMNSVRELAHILMETGRHSEAAFRLKQEYFLHVKTFGLTHHYTVDCCVEVGFGYAHQRRYSEGKLFFKEVIEMLHLSSEEPNSRTACIQNINAWMEELEEMRVKGSIGGGSETSESVDSERELMYTNDDVDYENMYDIPDPLDY